MAQTSPESPRRLIIKKYPNRRYYDATRSRHVTFEELHSLVRDGYELQVTDSKTGEDITGKPSMASKMPRKSSRWSGSRAASAVSWPASSSAMMRFSTS